MAQRSKRPLVLGVLVLVVGIPGFWLYPYYKMWSSFTPDQLREYERMLLVDGAISGVSLSDTPPPRTGRVVLIHPSRYKPGGRNIRPRTRVTEHEVANCREVDPPTLHEGMYGLSGSIRALDPSDVDTVIFCDRRSRTEFRKSKEFDIGPNMKMWYEWKEGNRQHMVLYAFDVESRKLLGAYWLAGPMPGPDVRAGESGPDPDVAALVEEMPLK